MLKSIRWLVLQSAGIPAARAGNWAATEVHGSAVCIKNNFDTIGIFQMFLAANRGRQRRHHRSRVVLENPHGQIDGLAGDLRFIALNIDDNFKPIHAGQIGCNLSGSVCPALVVSSRHRDFATKLSDGITDILVVSCDNDPRAQLALAGRFVGMLNQRFSRLGQQKLAFQSSRSQAGGNDDRSFQFVQSR